jgi:hypothetical protein
MKARVGDPPVLAYWVYWLNVILVPPTSHDRHSVSSGSSMASMPGQPAAVIDQLIPRRVTRSTTSDVRPGVVPATDLTWVGLYMTLRAPLRVETGSLGLSGWARPADGLSERLSPCFGAFMADEREDDLALASTSCYAVPHAPDV